MKSKEEDEDEIEHKEAVAVIEEKETIETIDPATQEQPVAIPVEEQEEKQVEKLVSDFDEETFWSEFRNQALQEFAEAENLKSEELKEVVNEYLFSEKPPLRDDVAKTMNERPKLSEFKTIVPSLTDRIMAFANDLKNPEAEA